MNTRTTRRFPHPRLFAAALLGGALAAAAPASAADVRDAGVAADTVRGCYVNGSGTIYRTHAPNAPSACKQSTHVPLSWPDGKDDDYPRYLLAEGLRASTRGFAVGSGDPGAGTIPATGNGSRLMWHQAKSAFRAGTVDGSMWNDPNVGRHSVAMGLNTVASGAQSLAMGHGSVASGTSAVALGHNTLASGVFSTALGAYASTDKMKGAFVYGDASSSTPVTARQTNQFVVRAQRFWFGHTNNVTATPGRLIETSTGAYLSAGGTWTNVSDVNRKHGFEDVDGEQVLEKLAAVPIRTWSYTEDEATVRHLGPTAQDFHAAFGLGDSETAIATVDADGVGLAAIQALEKRSRAQASAIHELKQENVALRATLQGVQRRLDALEERR